jgi:hypothetical protein
MKQLGLPTVRRVADNTAALLAWCHERRVHAVLEAPPAPAAAPSAPPPLVRKRKK